MTKIRYFYNNCVHISGVVIVICLLWVLSAVVVSAAATGYETEDTELASGMVVSISESSTATRPLVERAALDQTSKVIGVTTTVDDQTVTVGTGNSTVFVQTTGEASVFVTDINGTVEKGDLLAPSPLLGILMKADENTAPIVGIALQGFDEITPETKNIEEEGGTAQAMVGTLRINLDHKAASNQQANLTDSSLERLGRAVTGKNVSEIQVVAALAIFLIVLVAEGGIIYGAISSSITAVGRNPLAGKIIRRELTRVIGVALTVLIIGIAAIYAILWV